MYEIAVIRKGHSPQRSTAANADELRDAVFALIRSEGHSVLEADREDLTAFIAVADAEGFVGVECGPVTLTIRPRDDAQTTPPASIASGRGTGEHRVLRTDQLTRGMTVRLKNPADHAPADYNDWFTVVELVPGRHRTAAPVAKPLAPGDTLVPLPADTPWLVKDTAAPADLAPSTLGIHGPLADAWAAADKPTEPSA